MEERAGGGGTDGEKTAVRSPREGEGGKDSARPQRPRLSGKSGGIQSGRSGTTEASSSERIRTWSTRGDGPRSSRRSCWIEEEDGGSLSTSSRLPRD